MSFDRLPPLAAIRAFDALCRSKDFSMAALDLNVTEAAIHHQLRVLERFIGKRLVDRGGPGSHTTKFDLTPAGKQAAVWVTTGFHQLRKGMDAARLDDQPIVIGVPVSFGFCWLSPRLRALQEAFPSRQFELKAYYGGDPEGRLPGCDIRVVYGVGQAVDEDIALLTHLEAFPVCSTALVGGSTKLSYGDVKTIPLLRDRTPDMERSLPDWRPWFGRHGQDPDQFRYGAVASNTFLNIEAARRGQGIAMAFGVLVADDLAQGVLTRIFDSVYDIHCSYWIAVAHSAPTQAHAVAHWFLSQATAH
ncbi:LysR substrate-binding domain-containing protein [Bradyrhizobium sp. LA7.1]|uniref:LysR substrate-binding domain-containing protein n=1 Tax=Bradyrhizobium sp. LA7.1 TaxID=3156324 RepID=UPI0033913BFC